MFKAAKTAVFLLNQSASSYYVAEPIEEVKQRWLEGLQAMADDKAAVVELTIVTGYFDPYPLAVSPGVISQIEVAQPLMAEYNGFKYKERWDKVRKEISGGTTGFDG